LHEEVGFIAAALGWSYQEIMTFTHHERLRWVRTVNQINEQRKR
jgi:hypothetical protein